MGKESGKFPKCEISLLFSRFGGFIHACDDIEQFFWPPAFA